MVMNVPSKTQIDRLGDRLRECPHTEIDLRLLDDYRRSFGDAYENVIRIIREQDQFPTGRSPKSICSIVEKLCRESIRLTQIQDIAGCRVVVTDIVEQARVVALLIATFPGASVIDRHDNPSYGYRAVHIIAKISGKPVEIQIRTLLQHEWAEFSEKASDVIDPKIKYGGGPDRQRNLLIQLSRLVTDYEVLEKDIVTELTECHEPSHNVIAKREKLECLKNKLLDILSKELFRIDNQKEGKE